MPNLHQRLKLLLRARRARRRGDPELSQLGNLVGGARRAIDVGANRGVYTFWMSHLCQRVEAFEPNPELAARLSAVGLKNVSVHPLALSREEGTADLIVPPHRRGGLDDPGGSLVRWRDGMDGGASYSTQLATLDSFGFDDVDLIKIDVEGHEEAVLDGARRTIATCQPTLIIELEERVSAGCLARVAGRLSRLGYNGQFHDQGTWYPIEDLEGAQVAPSGRRVNNFTFATA